MQRCPEAPVEPGGKRTGLYRERGDQQADIARNGAFRFEMTAPGELSRPPFLRLLVRRNQESASRRRTEDYPGLNEPGI